MGPRGGSLFFFSDLSLSLSLFVLATDTQNRMLARSQLPPFSLFPRSSSAHTNHRRRKERSLSELALSSPPPLEKERKYTEREREEERPPARESHGGKQRRTSYPPPGENTRRQRNAKCSANILILFPVRKRVVDMIEKSGGTKGAERAD